MEAPNAGGGRLDAGAVAADWRLSNCRLSSVTSYHTERPPYLFEACSS